ncbi:hypothetical protein [Pseudomonas sp. NPDC096950]|uniref:hypothetical protein n=1 Tax=Pseudomonas sp. NPDC096950 TaxID=3364485 RepID=UPI00383A07C0
MKEAAMTRFFWRGLFRIGKWTGIATAVIVPVLVVFNVIGYQSITHNLIFWANPDYFYHQGSYLGRVLNLSLVGFLQSIVCAGIVFVVVVVLAAAFIGISYLGGYRDNKKGSVKC